MRIEKAIIRILKSAIRIPQSAMQWPDAENERDDLSESSFSARTLSEACDAAG